MDARSRSFGFVWLSCGFLRDSEDTRSRRAELDRNRADIKRAARTRNERALQTRDAARALSERTCQLMLTVTHVHYM